MRLAVVLAVAVVIAPSCGQEPEDQLASSARDVAPVDVGSEDSPRRALSAELPGDDPAFVAAIDAYDGATLEERTTAITGLRSDDLGGGYFGQQFYMSVWQPVPPDVALRACHELVAYANEIDFPATSISVRQKTYADLQSSHDLAVVDDSGTCVLTGA